MFFSKNYFKRKLLLLRLRDMIYYTANQSVKMNVYNCCKQPTY